ncbi:MAG TPA: hypothetical protein VMB34_02440 [Acetobacteraceae bacterium]|nr:hypothetical protein [Acetobacteraceae bacterium]
MSSAAQLLTGQFLDWIASGRRTHDDVMATWQSSCPRLSIWEDAMIGGLVRFAGDAERTVVLTPRGQAMLEAQPPVATRLAAD